MASCDPPTNTDQPPVDDVWCKGYISLNKVSDYLKLHHSLIAMSYPTIRQAVKDKALKVIEIGNQMRVTKENLEAFIKVVEEGQYVPSSSPEKAHWPHLTNVPNERS